MSFEYPKYEAELDDEPYRYYVLGVWVRPDGYYMGTDSGCSCYSPWENYTEDGLTGPLTFDQVSEESNSLALDEFARKEVAEMLDSIATDREAPNV
jgi:hypothetical protein